MGAHFDGKQQSTNSKNHQNIQSLLLQLDDINKTIPSIMYGLSTLHYIEEI